MSKQSSIMETYARLPLTLVRGEGSFVWDDQGRKYLDFTSGIAVCNLGHVPQPVATALKQQIDQLWHVSNLYHIPVQEQVADLLTEHSCMDRVFFCNSGAEANEAAIKLARRYASSVVNSEAREVVSFQGSFHGRTMATLSATGQSKVHLGFEPLVTGFRHIPFNDHSAIEGLDPQRTAAVLVELVQGEGGVRPAEQEWVHNLRDICSQRGILFMVDEVQTGVGRTGSFFAYEQYGIEPDVLTLAKGLGSGFPVGAMLAKDTYAAALVPGTHATTFGGNFLAMRAAEATVQTITAPGFLESVQELSQYFSEGLEALRANCSRIRSVRGLGLLLGIVLEEEPALNVVNRARDKGLLLLVAGSEVVRILPPLTASRAEIDQCLSVLAEIMH